MNNLRKYLSYASVGILFIALSSWQVSNSGNQKQVGYKTTETISITVEDGETGPYSALIVAKSTLGRHTIFRPKDLSVLAKRINCRLLLGVTGLVSIHHGTYQFFIRSIIL